MRIKLDLRWTKRLRELPESGMGYQRVDVLFIDGRELEEALVFNAQELDIPEEYARTNIRDIRLRT